MYINFIQSSSFNHWIKINFDSKWTLSFKILWCKILNFLLVFRIIKGYHQDFNLLCNIILVIHHLFFGEKWFTLCVFSPNVTYSRWLGIILCQMPVIVIIKALDLCQVSLSLFHHWFFASWLLFVITRP
jgi:hypothetical protein